MSTLEQTNLWQQLRDTASYIRDAYQRDQDRKTTLFNTIIGLENMTKYDKKAEAMEALNYFDGFIQNLDL